MRTTLKLLLLLILLCLPANVFATQITVASIDIPNSQANITKLRIYCNESFVTYSVIGADNNKLIQAGAPPSGSFYLEVAVSTPSPGVSRIPMLFLDSTTDGQTSKSARYTAYFVTSANKLINYGPFSDFAVPPVFDTGALATWSQIAIYNLGTAPIPPMTSTYSQETIDRKIAAINGLSNPMSAQGDFIVGGPGGMPMRFAATSDSVQRFMTELGPNNLPIWSTLTSANITTALGFTPANKAGDTFTGPLLVSADPTLPLQVATKQYTDSHSAGITTLNGINGSANPVQNFAVGGNFPNLTIVSTATGGVGTHTFNWTGSLSPARGGLGLTSYGTGEIPYTTGPTTFVSLAAAATGNVLISGALPSWGKVGLTTAVSGILPTINGGSGANLSSGTGYFKISSSGSAAALQGTIPATDGGTGFGNYTIGDTISANSTTTLAKVTGNITTTRKFYMGLGDGSNATVPIWDVVKASDINVSGGLLTLAQGGTGQASFGAGYIKSSGAALSSQAVPIPAADLLSTNTTNGLVYSLGASVRTTALGAANTIAVGTGAAPAFSGTPTVTSISLLGLTNASIPFINSSKLVTEDNAFFNWDDSAKQLNVQGGVKFFNSGGGNILLSNSSASGVIKWNFPASRPGGTNYSLVGTPNGDGVSIDLAWTASGGGGGTPITINGSGDSAFIFTEGTTGTDFAHTTVSASGTTTVTYNLPSYLGGVTTRGILSNAAQSFDGLKTFSNGLTSNGLLTLATNTTTVAPIRFNSFTSLLTTPVAYTVEYDGTRLYFDNSVATRKSVAFLDDNITGSAASFTGTLTGDITGTQGATTYSGILSRSLGGLGNDPSTPSDGYFLRYDAGSGHVLFSADGGFLNGLNATNLSAGTVALARLSGITNTQIDAAAAIAWSKISKSGSSLADLTTVSAADISSGTLSDSRLSANVQLITGRDSGCSGCSSATGYAGIVSGLLQRAEGLEVFSVTDLSTYASTSGAGTTAILSTISSVANGQLLTYKTSTGDWINTPGINTSRTLTDGDVLKWVSASSRWENSAPAAATATNLLQNSAHSDTDDGTPVRADIIVANATPHWARLGKDASNSVLINDGTDTKWGKVDLGTSTYITGALLPVNGGTGLTSGTSGGILAFTSTTTVASSALLTLNGVVLGGGAGAVPGVTPAGTANQVFRVPSAGTAPRFGSIDVSSSAAVTGLLAPANAGTGVNNGSSTITIGGNFATSGAFSTTFTVTGTTTLTLPTTGTVSTSDSTTTFTNKTLDTEATGNTITVPVPIWFQACGVNNTVAVALFEIPAVNPPTATAENGTNIDTGYLSYSASATNTAQFSFALPTDWTGNVDVSLISFSASSNASTVAQWDISCGCGTGDDPAFNTSSTPTQTYTSANVDQTTTATSITTTGCAAGDMMYLRVQRSGAAGGDTFAGTSNLRGVIVKIRRAL